MPVVCLLPISDADRDHEEQRPATGPEGEQRDSSTRRFASSIGTAKMATGTSATSIVHGHQKVRSYGHGKSALVAMGSPQC